MLCSDCGSDVVSQLRRAEEQSPTSRNSDSSCLVRARNNVLRFVWIMDLFIGPWCESYESRRGYQVSHVWDNLLLTDAIYRKSVLTSSEDLRSEVIKSRLYFRGVVGRGRKGRRPPTFRQGGTRPPLPHFFGLKFVQTLVHCCNWLLTETQCKIIFV